jgi:hypothetical protein
MIRLPMRQYSDVNPAGSVSMIARAERGSA